MRQACPIFPVKDLRAALDHYASLGFAVRAYADGDYYPDGTVSVAYLVVGDADQLAAEWTRDGIAGHTNPPVDTPWGMREGTHFDRS